MSVVEVTAELDAQLDELVRSSGGTKVEHVRRALLEYLGEAELSGEAEARLADIEGGRARTVPLAELLRVYGLAG